ncbi:MAG: CRISPR-associated protein Csx20 [Campylobacterota bacterium]|nr:CRISPR-associated protein Csx20 [Campylobacterota bacterium]
MFILLSHQMTPVQYEDAKESLHVKNFTELSKEIWSQIPCDCIDISEYLVTIKHNILKSSKAGDILLVQGDFGATVAMVQFAHKNDLIPVYATTKRIAKDRVDGDKVVTVRTFEHVRFREYTKGY